VSEGGRECVDGLGREGDGAYDGVKMGCRNRLTASMASEADMSQRHFASVRTDVLTSVEFCIGFCISWSAAFCIKYAGSANGCCNRTKEYTSMRRALSDGVRWGTSTYVDRSSIGLTYICHPNVSMRAGAV